MFRKYCCAIMGYDNKITSNNSTELYVDKNKIIEKNRISKNDNTSNQEISCKSHNLLIENNSDNYQKSYKTCLYNHNFKEIEHNNYSTENNDKGVQNRDDIRYNYKKLNKPNFLDADSIECKPNYITKTCILKNTINDVINDKKNDQTSIFKEEIKKDKMENNFSYNNQENDCGNTNISLYNLDNKEGVNTRSNDASLTTLCSTEYIGNKNIEHNYISSSDNKQNLNSIDNINILNSTNNDLNGLHSYESTLKDYEKDYGANTDIESEEDTLAQLHIDLEKKERHKNVKRKCWEINQSDIVDDKINNIYRGSRNNKNYTCSQKIQMEYGHEDYAENNMNLKDEKEGKEGNTHSEKNKNTHIRTLKFHKGDKNLFLHFFNGYNKDCMNDSKRKKYTYMKEFVQNQINFYDFLLEIHKNVPLWGEYESNFFFHWKKIMEIRIEELKIYKLIFRSLYVESVKYLHFHILKIIIDELDELRKVHEPQYIKFILSESYKKNYESNFYKTSNIHPSMNEYIQPHHIKHIEKSMDVKKFIKSLDILQNSKQQPYIVQAIEIPSHIFNMYQNKLKDEVDFSFFNSEYDNNITIGEIQISANKQSFQKNTELKENTEQSNGLFKIKSEYFDNQQIENNSEFSANLYANTKLVRDEENEAKSATKNTQKISSKKKENYKVKKLNASINTKPKKRTGYYDLEIDGVVASFEARKGVYYDKSRKLWRANWKENGKIQTKGFSVNEYKSVQLARQKAIEWREMKEVQLLL
ncbi:AP2 domain transcription factor, putative [Plasmodium chabaudi chabaudi]|uniref:AP2 domain transcription factor, putative n=1 Tax=Plasmodium chabaudi chabaudi TaxID=31271 RepID=A0A4V0KAR7_PLACU|nr:AP2 domain transcription factor, putative [Plasmodium chabaudi chabaudi]VTZ70180.1 AP2 domain transcription factor, putative [Plasmodium chabaudi chabaudi]|eukprot:XP_016654528.1 transcription factor with AP2 domain(s), putative [Plasmodium chabaudi chabaudi]